MLNYLRQFKVFHTFNGKIKGIRWSNFSLLGTDTTYIPIKTYYVTVSHIKVPDAVFVPLSLFKLLSPQLFIPALRNSGQDTNYSKHENVKYISNYKLPSKSKERWRKLMIPIIKNRFFAMRTNDKYKSLFNQASTYYSEWGNFSGACHKIPEDNDKKTSILPTSSITLQSKGVAWQ